MHGVANINDHINQIGETSHKLPTQTLSNSDLRDVIKNFDEQEYKHDKNDENDENDDHGQDMIKIVYHPDDK